MRAAQIKKIVCRGMSGQNGGGKGGRCHLLSWLPRKALNLPANCLGLFLGGGTKGHIYNSKHFPLLSCRTAVPSVLYKRLGLCLPIWVCDVVMCFVLMCYVFSVQQGQGNINPWLCTALRSVLYSRARVKFTPWLCAVVLQVSVLYSRVRVILTSLLF